MRPIVIQDLLRRTEVANLVAASKARKTYLPLDLAISVATGRKWLGRFQTNIGRVLYIDLELHAETLAARLGSIVKATKVDRSDLAYLDLYSLRGVLPNINELQPRFAEFHKKYYSLIIIDALYKIVPETFDENSNSDVTRLYKTLDEYAMMTGAAIVCVHHASKGNQAGKSTTDVGSGAGAQSRSVDAHIVLRPHQEPDAAVMDCALRSFPPLSSMALRWNCPRWRIDTRLDPTSVKPSKPSATPAGPTWTPERLVAELLNGVAVKKSVLVTQVMEKGLSKRRAAHLIELAEHKNLIQRLVLCHTLILG